MSETESTSTGRRRRRAFAAPLAVGRDRRRRTRCRFRRRPHVEPNGSTVDDPDGDAEHGCRPDSGRTYDAETVTSATARVSSTSRSPRRARGRAEACRRSIHREVPRRRRGRVRLRQAGQHRHCRSRRRRRDGDHGCFSRTAPRRRPRSSARPLDRHRRNQGERRSLAADTACPRRQRRSGAGRGRRGDREPVRVCPTASLPGSSAPSTATSRHPTATRSRTRSRRMPRSTTATRAAR